MSRIAKELADPFHTIGNHWIAAWAVEEAVSWVQVRCPEMGQMVKKLVECRRVVKKLVECRRVMYGVQGGYLETYEVKRTLPWVGREIVEKILAHFPNKNEGSKTPMDQHAATRREEV